MSKDCFSPPCDNVPEARYYNIRKLAAIKVLIVSIVNVNNNIVAFTDY